MNDRLFKRMKSFLRGETGFTLLEMGVVVVVMGLIIVAILPYIKVNVLSYTTISLGKYTTQSARIALSRMFAEMKMIESWQELDVVGDDRIRFDIPGEDNIYYYYHPLSKTLRRNNIPFLELVQSFVIRYFRSDGSEKTSFFLHSDIWRIEIEMEVGDGETIVVLQGQVSPRGIHYDG